VWMLKPHWLKVKVTIKDKRSYDYIFLLAIFS